MLKVKGFGADPFVTVGLFVQWVIGNVGVGRARGPGGGSGHHLWASRLLLRHVAGPNSGHLGHTLGDPCSSKVHISIYYDEQMMQNHDEEDYR